MVMLEDRILTPTPVGGCLCPLGYAAKIDSVVEEVMQAYSAAVLLDIRFVARSRWYPRWNKGVLQAKWGGRYVHEKRLGNVNYQYSDCPIELLDPEAALPSLLVQLQQGVIFLLLCACRDYSRCHRKVVAEYILRRCSDVRREIGMRFDVGRNLYVGSLPGGDGCVMVEPLVFERYRQSLCGSPALYDVLMWAEVAYGYPGLATIEIVG